MTDVILETKQLTKEFKGFTAVSEVNLSVQRGHIHALIGPNGAGKTTCFNLLTKFLRPSRGQIVYNGLDITALPPAAVARLRLVRSFQISAVFPHLTVLENVRIALQRRRGGSFDFWRSTRVLDALNGRALGLIGDVGLASFAAWKAVELPYGRKRALEIATTLALDPEMLLLVDALQAWYGESHILHGASFQVFPGEVVTLLGRNGAGKTTTLKSIMGIVGQRQGSVRFEDRELIGRTSDQIARSGIAFCPE